MPNTFTAEQREVLDAIEAENAAFWMKDEAAYLRLRPKSGDAMRWGYWQAGGMFRRTGWDDVVPAAIAHMRLLERPIPEFAHVALENVVVHVSGDMAWALFDRLHPPLPGIFGFGPNGTTHCLQILERVEGRWLIVGEVLFDAHLGDEVAVRVNAGGDVVWSSRLALERLGDDGSFVVRAGRLRLRDRRLDVRLQSSIRWAAGLGGPLMPRRGAVPIVVENAPGAMRVAWVIAEDHGHALVLLDDPRPLTERIDNAAQVYGLSPAQRKLALAIADGRSPADYAARAGVSLNTAKTHLKRLFEKTGVSSQPALVRALLSLVPPR
jgi:DNA-binding CsgD family transcriptional regulator